VGVGRLCRDDAQVVPLGHVADEQRNPQRANGSGSTASRVTLSTVSAIYRV
jgi:hypothetical protein